MASPEWCPFFVLRERESAGGGGGGGVSERDREMVEVRGEQKWGGKKWKMV